MSMMEAPRDHFAGDISKFLQDLLVFIAGDGKELEELARSTKRSACGAVFKINDLVYSCRTCEGHFTSVICDACFNGGNHEGHDYSVTITKGDLGSMEGGFCDCGDLAAWKKEGCCPQHQGQVNLELSPALHERTNAAFSLLVSRLRGSLESENKNAALFAEVAEIKDWLVSLVKKYGEGLARVLVKIITTPIPALNAPPPSPCSLVGLIVSMSSNLDASHSSLRDSLHNMMFVLIVDHIFKKALGIEFTLRYRETILACGGNRVRAVTEKSIACYDAHLFVWPELANEFAKDGALRAVLNVFMGMIEDILVPGPSTPNKKVPDPERVQGMLTIDLPLEDLQILLSHTVVAQWVVYQSQDILKDILKMLGYIQGIAEQVRVTGAHVEYEDQTIMTCLPFAFNIGCVMRTELLIAGFLAGTEVIPPPYAPYSTNTPKASPSPALLAEVQQVISLIASHVQKLAEDEEIKLTNIEEGYTSITYDVLSQPVSIHYPLNRALARFLQRAMTTWKYSLEELLGQRSVCLSQVEATEITNYDSVFPLILLDKVATVFAFESHVHAGLWRKNGEPIHSLALSYRDFDVTGRYFDLDLLTLQMCACMIEPDQMLYTLIRRFGLQQWWELDVAETKTDHAEAKLEVSAAEAANNDKEKPEAPANDGEVLEPAPTAEPAELGSDQPQNEHFAVAATFFVRMLVGMVRNSSLCGLPLDQVIRMEIIHRLAVSPHSHSSLVEYIGPSTDITNDQQFDSILKEVSTYVLPHGMDQGKYFLKPEYWNQWDPYFFHYSNYDRQVATEKYEEHLKSVGKKHIPLSKPNPVPPAYSKLRNILQSKIVHRIIFVSLRDFLASSDRINETEVTVVLHLLHQCLLFSTPLDSRDGDAKITDLNFPTNNIFENSRVIVTHPKLEESTSILSMVIKLHKTHPAFALTIKEILDIYSADSKANEIIQQQVVQKETSEDKPTDKEKLRLQRLAIMNQFAAQQKAFLAEASTTEDDAANDSPQTTSRNESENVCVMCREHKNSADNPLHYMALISKSNLIHQQAQQAWKNFAEERDRISTESFLSKMEENLKEYDPEISKYEKYLFTDKDGNEDADSNSNENEHADANTETEQHLTINTNTDNDNNNSDTTLIYNTSNIEDAEQASSSSTQPTQQVNIPSVASPSSWFSTLIRWLTKTISWPFGFLFRRWTARPAIVINNNQTDSTTSSTTNTDTTNNNSNNNNDNQISEEDKKFIAAVQRLCFLLTQNTGNIPGISILSCPHMVHGDCFLTYLLSFDERFGILVNGKMELNIDSCEFTCPLCNRLANTLIPVVEIPVPSIPTLELAYARDEITGWIQRHTNTALPPPVQYSLTSTLKANISTFLIKLAAVDPLDPNDDLGSNLSMLDQLAVNISHLEFAARDANKFLLDYTTHNQKEFLNNLAKTYCIVVSHKFLYPIHAVTARVFMTPGFPLLQVDPFYFYVRYVISQGYLSHFSDSHAFLQILYYANVVQAVHTLITRLVKVLDREDSPDGIKQLSAEAREKSPEIVFADVVTSIFNVSGDFKHSVHAVVLDQITSLCLPFLRKAGLFAESCLFHRETNPEREFNTLTEEYHYWMKYLHLVDIASFDPAEAGSPFVTMLRQWIDDASAPKAKVLALTPPVPFQLIELPTHYSELLTTFVKAKCAVCKTVPANPGLCLVCGTLVCIKGACCSERGHGECVEHTIHCFGGGMGLFLDLKGQYIMVIKEGSCTSWGSVYLDQYGEEDIELKRSVPLILNAERYTQLRRLWVTKNMEQIAHQNRVLCDRNDVVLY